MVEWLAVHLFTLGVVTNLILALSDHFARTLTRQPGDAPIAELIAANVGAVAVFIGVAKRSPVVGCGRGGPGLRGWCSLPFWRLRHLRRTSLGAPVRLGRPDVRTSARRVPLRSVAGSARWVEASSPVEWVGAARTVTST